jgi:thiamine-phosphate pyrophosphorylase
MADRCLLYYITDRAQFPGDEAARRRALLAKIAEATRAGMDYIQLREKDLSTRELESIAEKAAHIIRGEGRLATSDQRPVTRLLINSRTDIALATGADGVHLRSNDVFPKDVRRVWSLCGSGAPAREGPRVAVSCHSKSDVVRAESEGATFVVFAPVFEKRDRPGTQPTGLAALQEACRAKIPVLALGGVTFENAASCLHAGAAGIAAIRLFQENRIEDVVRALRIL